MLKRKDKADNKFGSAPCTDGGCLFFSVFKSFWGVLIAKCAIIKLHRSKSHNARNGIQRPIGFAFTLQCIKRTFERCFTANSYLVDYSFFTVTFWVHSLPGFGDAFDVPAPPWLTFLPFFLLLWFVPTLAEQSV